MASTATQYALAGGIMGALGGMLDYSKREAEERRQKSLLELQHKYRMAAAKHSDTLARNLARDQADPDTELGAVIDADEQRKADRQRETYRAMYGGKSNVNKLTPNHYTPESLQAFMKILGEHEGDMEKALAEGGSLLEYKPTAGAFDPVKARMDFIEELMTLTDETGEPINAKKRELLLQVFDKKMEETVKAYGGLMGGLGAGQAPPASDPMIYPEQEAAEREMLIGQARQAIQAGADPEAVKARLRSMGVPEALIQGL